MELVLEEPLKTFFGYNEFRFCQREIVKALLEGKDVLAILPTGAGKSICYQLPAMLLPGIAVVVSPLISLMQDQVVSLSKNGIPAVFLNSSLHYSEMQTVLRNLSQYKLLYVAPERFADPHFLQVLHQTRVSLFAIDEAHCISQWGHSFRPDYRQLSILKKNFPNSPIVALTATATRDVERDILAELAMKDPQVARASFDRPNLSFHVQARTNAEGQLRSFLQRHKGQSGIIYAATRKTVDETYEALTRDGIQVGRYHAGLSDADRTKVQHDFVHGELLLIVATVAFGMGIHKPDIRFIAHMDMPRSLEQYYQEVGRAGRDGLPAECLMLYSAKELMVYDFFLQQIPDEIVRNATRVKTKKIYSFCLSAGCRRKELLSYFGERYTAPYCKGCNNCLDNSELIDETIAAQKILSCVYRLDHRFGTSHVIEVLRGGKGASILNKGHDLLSTYGIMQDYSTETLRSYIDTLISLGYLERTGETYPVLKWTASSPLLIKGTERFFTRKKMDQVFSKAKKTQEELEYDKNLFNHLSRLRRSLAQNLDLPTFVIFGDRVLMEMSRNFPTTRDAMLKINGVGPVKWERYGQMFLDAIQEYRGQQAKA